MTRKGFSEEQNVGLLREHEAGGTAREVRLPTRHFGVDVFPLGVGGRRDGGLRDAPFART